MGQCRPDNAHAGERQNRCSSRHRSSHPVACSHRAQGLSETSARCLECIVVPIRIETRANRVSERGLSPRRRASARLPAQRVLGLALARAGVSAAARAALERALELEPEATWAARSASAGKARLLASNRSLLERGCAIVVWTSDGQDGHRGGNFGRRYASDGMPLGSEFLVNTTTALSQHGPDVALSPAGDFVVVWAGEVLFYPVIYILECCGCREHLPDPEPRPRATSSTGRAVGGLPAHARVVR